MRPAENIKNCIKKIDVTPSAEMNRQILKDIFAAQEEASQKFTADLQPTIWRIIMNRPFTKLTVAAVIVIAAFILFHSTTLVNPTFADVIKPLFNAQTIAFDMIFGQEGQAPVMHDIVKGQLIRRTMSNLPNVTMIIDIEGEKMLNLYSEDGSKGMAEFIDIKGPIKEGTKNFLAFIRDTLKRVQASPDFKAEELPKKEFDGRMLIGFLSKGPNENITIWADPKTALPVRIEMKLGQQDVLIKNFEFNIPVDDSLVSMKLPAGFTAKPSQMDLTNPTEQDFIKILEIWAKVLLDGRFPDAVSTQEFLNMINPMMQKLTQQGVSEQEGQKIGESYAKGMMFLQLFELQGKGPWHYAGKGVKFGDASKAVFWYKFKDAKTWRVIYGDMSVKDVAEENLPK
jgi:outer membrane lipoprotein-sorting protein